MLFIDWTRMMGTGKPIMCRAKSGRVIAKASPTFNDEVKWTTKIRTFYRNRLHAAGPDNRNIYCDLSSSP